MDLYAKFLKFKQEKDIRKAKPRPILIFDMMYIFRSQFSAQTLITEEGVRMGGVGGAVRYIENMIKLYNPKNVVCVFDGKNNASKKQEMDENYKADRGQKHKMLRSPLSYNEADAQKQMELELGMLIKILQLLPVKTIEINGLEADDVIGYLTKQYYPDRNTNVMIFSADKDFIQLIDNNTVWYNCRKKEIVNLDNYTQYWEVPIENVIYIRSIEGDTSDKLAGIKGLGTKTLLELLPEISEIPFKSIDDFLSFIQSIQERLSTTKKGKLLVESESTIRTSYNIMQLSKPMIDNSQEHKILTIMDDEVYNIRNRDKLFDYLKSNLLTSIISTYRIDNFFKILR